MDREQTQEQQPRQPTPTQARVRTRAELLAELEAAKKVVRDYEEPGAPRTHSAHYAYAFAFGIEQAIEWVLDSCYRPAPSEWARKLLYEVETKRSQAGVP